MAENYTKVRGYKDEELLQKVSELNDFRGFPQGRWWIFVRSNEDTPNVYDDKGYLYETTGNKTKFIDVVTCTTNPSTEALKGGFRKFNKKGTALIKANQWCYNAYYYGLHRGRMPALRQRLNIWYHRDGNLNDKSEEIGEPEHALFYTNIHSNTYKHFNSVVQWFIGGWSYGCIVINQRDKYLKYMNWFKAKRASGEQKYVTICIITEF